MTLASTLRSLFNPTRPRAAECLALVTDAASADEAWERLCARSLLPLEFMGSTARSFGPAARVSRPASHAAGRCRGTRCEHWVPSTWLAPRSRVPATKLAAATIASDPEAIATAESLARECAARLRVTVPRLFHWRVADRAVGDEKRGADDESDHRGRERPDTLEDERRGDAVGVLALDDC